MSGIRNESPIAVLDSGLGGLTVLRALMARLPHEDIVYLGDTARTPYGTRTRQTILNYAHACASVLRSHRIKSLVVACHAMSAVALEALSAELFVPALGVIGPSARAGVAASSGRRIGVIAQPSTVRSGAYQSEIAAAAPQAHAFVQATPLLVPLVEEGWVEGDVPRLAVRKYLSGLVAQQIDALVLGCNHYPVLEPLIRSELAAASGREIPIVEGARALADELAALIEDKRLATQRTEPGQRHVILTDVPEGSAETASRLLGEDISRLHLTTIDL
jgi:glutamate racemase